MDDASSTCGGDPRVTGGTYYSGYWGQEYTVLERTERDGVTWFTVRWADGRVTTHCTAWEPWRDRVAGRPR